MYEEVFVDLNTVFVFQFFFLCFGDRLPFLAERKGKEQPQFIILQQLIFLDLVCVFRCVLVVAFRLEKITYKNNKQKQKDDYL